VQGKVNGTTRISIKESSWRHKVKIMLLELVRVWESGLGLELGFSEVT
jgi:hypothetical protein